MYTGRAAITPSTARACARRRRGKGRFMVSVYFNRLMTTRSALSFSISSTWLSRSPLRNPIWTTIRSTAPVMPATDAASRRLPCARVSQGSSTLTRIAGSEEVGRVGGLQAPEGEKPGSRTGQQGQTEHEDDAARVHADRQQRCLGQQ